MKVFIEVYIDNQSVFVIVYTNTAAYVVSSTEFFFDLTIVVTIVTFILVLQFGARLYFVDF
jgi:hypothetical protein